MVFFEREQLHPAADRFRHAQQLAAQHNGPLSRNDKQCWQTSHLLPPDPWVPPPPPAPELTPATLAAQVARINQGID